MIRYVLVRTAMLLPVLLGVVLSVFLMLKALPGDPAENMIGERADPAAVEKIRKELGADKSVPEQFGGYIGLLARGDMGRSLFTNRSVSEDIRAKFPNTLFLASAAICLAVPLGVLLGIAGAVSGSGKIRAAIYSFSIWGISVPVFLNGLILMIVFGLWLKILPPSGTGGVAFLVLPATALSLPALAAITRITRVSVDDVMRMPFIRTARAKGLPESTVYAVHVLKNVLIPVITVTGLDIGSYLNGAVLTETIFGWDGMGRYMMEAITRRDYPVIMGCIITGTAAFVLVNLVVDIAYHFADPRVKLHESRR